MGLEEETCKYAYSYSQLAKLIELEHKQIWSLCRSSKKDVVELSTKIDQVHSLAYLNLESNFIGDSGVQVLAPALKKNPVLSVLGLKNNKIGKVGAKALATVLEVNFALNCLDLDDNSVGDTGAQALAYSLNENKTLTELYLKGNNIGNSGAIAFASAIIENESLIYLDLDSNVIKEAGAKSLLHALQENRTLTDLYINDNQVDKQSKIKLLLKRNKKVQKKAFKDAFKKGQPGQWNRAKLMVIGQGKSGKTSTIRSLFREPFDSKWNSTIGVTLTTAETTSSINSSWKKVEDGKQSYYAMEFAARVAATELSKPYEIETPEFRKKSNSSDESQGSTSSATESQSHSNSISIPSGNENLESVIDREEMLESLLVNARKSIRMQPICFSIWDLGGQTVFYSMHHLFLTRYGIYLLIFDMRELFENETVAVHYLKFWINSVNLHAPRAPVLLIGTFLEDVNTRGKLDKIEKILKVNLELGSKFTQIVHNRKDQRFFFPIDNSTSKGTDLIRGIIEMVTRDQDFMQKLVSLRWMCCLDKMLEESDSKSWISMKDVKKLAKGLKITANEEINSMLALFHELGVVMHLTATQALRDVVTLKPQWLINSLSKVIRDGRIHVLEMDSIEKAGLRKDVTKLFQHALASRDLLEYWWGKKNIEFLLDLMRQALLLSDWEFGSEKLYLIPSLAPHGSGRERTLSGNIRIPENGSVGATCIFDFSSSYLPIGVFQRLVCICVSHSGRISGSEEPILYNKWSRIRFGKKNVIYLEERDASKILLTVAKEKSASSTFVAILSMLRKINQDVMSQGLTWDVKFEMKKTEIESNNGVSKQKRSNVRTELVSYKEAKMQNLKPWFGEVDFQRSNVSDRDVHSDVDISLFLRNLEN
mmetsp:Transcript_4380/g.5815  ORF Transcript_4380/g.5815 Transcript_4380/m.5815 type:complete len:879 (-) Transcript_4380:1011-3647(-)